MPVVGRQLFKIYSAGLAGTPLVPRWCGKASGQQPTGIRKTARINQFGDRHTWRLADIHPPISSDGFFYQGVPIAQCCPSRFSFSWDANLMLSTAASRPRFTHLTRPHNGAYFLGGTSCSNTQESIDSDDEDTAVSFNNPTGQKTGDSKPTQQKVQQPHVPWHHPGWKTSSLTCTALEPKNTTSTSSEVFEWRRMALERVHYLNHISIITHWWCISHFHSFPRFPFEVNSHTLPTQLENVSVLLPPVFSFHSSFACGLDFMAARRNNIVPTGKPIAVTRIWASELQALESEKNPSLIGTWIPLDPIGLNRSMIHPWLFIRATLRIAFTLSVVFSKTAHAAAISAVATNANKMAETMRRSNCSIFTFLPHAERKLIHLIQPMVLPCFFMLVHLRGKETIGTLHHRNSHTSGWWFGT